MRYDNEYIDGPCLHVFKEVYKINVITPMAQSNLGP